MNTKRKYLLVSIGVNIVLAMMVMILNVNSHVADMEVEALKKDIKHKQEKIDQLRQELAIHNLMSYQRRLVDRLESIAKTDSLINQNLIQWKKSLPFSGKKQK